MSDIETIRALNLAARYQATNRPPFGKVYRYAGRTVLCGRPNLPFGASVQSRAYLSHIPIGIYTAWRKGHLCGQMARWRCGTTSRFFQLSPEPTYRLCHLCAALTGGRQTGVVVTVWSAS